MADFINREQLAEQLIEELDIPISYYEKAIDRASSLEDWLLRDNSSVKDFQPEVYPQGSFRYGTVIRPFHEDGYYDLDLVVTFALSMAQVTQEKVKRLLGKEIISYAIAKHFNEKPSEKPRCWRLNYADEVNFHMDVLPGLPAGTDAILERIRLSTPYELAQHEIVLTDTRHPFYKEICTSWFSSNPRGFAKWFETIARNFAQARIEFLIANRAYASIDEIPPYELKTVLQRVIQILKRHRDVHFQNDPTYAPISMIITTLSTHAYQGESSLVSALLNVVDRMPMFIKPQRPRIENPVNKKEDFADKWGTDSNYEINFWSWYHQLRADLQSLLDSATGYHLQESVEKAFGIKLRDESVGIKHSSFSTTAQIASPATLYLPSGPKPWGN
ncbi:nucleotidyltransferase domain-containing protein [Pirellulaceae bacterium SH449]